MNTEQVKQGSLLIAPPHMTDYRFAGSVMLVTHQTSATGTVALCVNSETSFNVNDLREEINIDGNLPFPLYWGGPVQPGSIWMLHDSDWRMSNTLEVNHSWSMTSNRDMFANILEGDMPRQFRFMHGFASWAPGQLKRELEGEPPWSSTSSWLVSEDPGVEWLFDQPEGTMWETCMQKATEEAVDSWF